MSSAVDTGRVVHGVMFVIMVVVVIIGGVILVREGNNK